MAAGDLTHRAGKDENDLLNRIASLEDRVKQLEANLANNNYIPKPSTTFSVTSGSTDTTYTANSTTTTELGNVLYTLLNALGLLA